MPGQQRKRRQFDAALPQSLRTAQQRMPETLTAVGVTIDPDDFKLTMIDATALGAWKEQWQYREDSDRGGFDWRSDLAKRQGETAPFHVAVWYKGRLCGFGLGRFHKGHVDVELMEGCPDPEHPLKGSVRYCVLEAALAFAQRVGAGSLRIIDPLEPVLPHYKQ